MIAPVANSFGTKREEPSETFPAPSESLQEFDRALTPECDRARRTIPKGKSIGPLTRRRKPQDLAILSSELALQGREPDRLIAIQAMTPTDHPRAKQAPAIEKDHPSFACHVLKFSHKGTFVRHSLSESFRRLPYLKSAPFSLLKFPLLSQRKFDRKATFDKYPSK